MPRASRSTARSARATGAQVGRTLLALMAAALLLKLIALWQLHAHPLLRPRAELDNGVYLDLARQIAGGDIAGGDRVYFMSPLYMYFEAAILAVSGGSVLAVQIVQVVLGSIAVGLIAAIAGRRHGAAGAWTAGVLAILTGYFTFNEILLLQSSLDVFLTALGLWLLIRATRPRDYVLLGFVVGLHVLNRPNVAAWAATLLILLVAGEWPLTQRSEKPAGRRWVPAAATCAGLVLALAPVAIRNSAISGEPVLVSSHGGLNFYIGNNANAPGTYRTVPGITPSITGQDRDMRDVVSAAVGHTVTDVEASRWFYDQAWNWIMHNPGDALKLFLKKTAYMGNATDVALNDSYSFFARDEPSVLRMLIVGPWVLIPLGVLGLVVAWPLRDTRLILAVFVVVYAVSVAVFFVAGRYRLPMLAALCVAASGALVEGWRHVQTQHWRWVSWVGAALVVLIVAVNVNLGLDDGRLAAKAEMVLEFIRQGRTDLAEESLKALEPSFPNRGLLHYRTAQTYVALGDAGHAVQHLERAAVEAPDRPDIQLELGHALLMAERPRDAVPALRAALNARFKPEIAAADLARALTRGARGDALVALRGIHDPTSLPAPALSILGRLALDAGDVPLGVEWLSRAAASTPDLPTLEALGQGLAGLGRLPEAATALETACRLYPADPSARVNLAVTYAQMGRFADAKRETEEALKLNPQYEKARRLLGSLNARGLHR